VINSLSFIGILFSVRLTDALPKQWRKTQC